MSGRCPFLFCFVFLNLRTQLLQGSVAIDPVRDVVAKAVAEQSLAVRFPDTVALTQPAEVRQQECAVDWENGCVPRANLSMKK